MSDTTIYSRRPNLCGLVDQTGIGQQARPEIPSVDVTSSSEESRAVENYSVGVEDVRRVRYSLLLLLPMYIIYNRYIICCIRHVNDIFYYPY